MPMPQPPRKKRARAKQSADITSAHHSPAVINTSHNIGVDRTVLDHKKTYERMPSMKRQRALAIVFGHVWFVNAFVSPPPSIRRHQQTLSSSSVTPSSAQQQQSTVVVLQGTDEIQLQPNITDRLWTYAYNIPKASRQHSAPKDQTRPVYSLVTFLQDSHVSHDVSIEEALERATIQAVRAASAAGDYRLIFRVVESAIGFAQSQSSSMLQARLFGEAIESLSRTKCNISKLKQMWKLSQQHASLLKEPGMGAFELNTILRALASRGKIRAALDLYESETIEGDAYTMSTLLTALTTSISEDQPPAKDWSSSNNRGESPCWQYIEGRRLVENSCRNQLNNHVFAAALRLNERAGQVFDSPRQRHYTAKSAMDLLQLMKVRCVMGEVWSVPLFHNVSFLTILNNRNWRFHQMSLLAVWWHLPLIRHISTRRQWHCSMPWKRVAQRLGRCLHPMNTCIPLSFRHVHDAMNTKLLWGFWRE